MCQFTFQTQLYSFTFLAVEEEINSSTKISIGMLVMSYLLNTRYLKKSFCFFFNNKDTMYTHEVNFKIYIYATEEAKR